ncbi:MAG: peptidylprolyl isomerase [Pyrinomonadaceae bacterium]
MKKLKVVLISIAIATLIGGAFLKFRDWRANAERTEESILRRLSSKDLALIVKSEALGELEAIKKLKDDKEKRTAFLKALREYMAIAAEARREGYADREEFKTNRNYKVDIFLSDQYRQKLSKGMDRLYVVRETDAEKYLANRENLDLYRKTMDTLRKISAEDKTQKGHDRPLPKPSESQEKESMLKWSRIRILSEKARNDADFMKDPAIGLRIKVIEAGILSADYLRDSYVEKIKPRPDELKRFLAGHPEYNPETKRNKALKILAQIKNGAKIKDLAPKVSEDRTSAERGGEYLDVSKGVLWKEVEDAAYSIKEGDTYPELIESAMGWHIVQLIKRKETKDNPTYSFRQILIQKTFEEPGEGIPGIPKPFVTPTEIAKLVVEREKKAAFVSAIVARNPVELPEDFEVILPQNIEKKPDANPSDVKSKN